MSLRTALLVLAFVPGIALVALWSVTSGQTFLDFQRQAAQGLLAEKAGKPSNVVYYNLQEERRLSAEVLAGQQGAPQALARQRESTDEAVATFRSLSDDVTSADDAPAEVRDAVAEAREAIGQLPAQRSLVDDGDRDQQEAVYRYYTDLIAVDLQLFTALSHVDNGRITTLSQPLVDLFWAKEMISRSDALLARGWGSGELGTEDLQQVRQAVAGQSFLHSTKVAPYLPDDELAMWQRITAGPAWKAKTRVEQTVLRPAEPDARGHVRLGAERKTWRGAMDALTPELEKLLEHRTALVVEEGKGSVMSLLFQMVLTTVVGLAAVVAVIWTTWRLTRSLRRRISGLQEQAEVLEKVLPDVVERLAQGERIDVETEARAIRQESGSRVSDELTRLGDALNLARTSALQAAVKQADQHRGFERLLQRIARRTQQLIGQQLKKLDEMERRHEDSEVLDGLFDLDHLTARLRRYEENLVILAGGTPHRRWRNPVALLDVMRAAQGEVQDYQRVLLEIDGSHWLAPRAVGPVSHVLAELMENALSFSRPPSPVEVRVAVVGRGLAIEVEDRGLGMDEDQLAAANELMGRPPRLDILAHSEDIRLGLHVIARIAAHYGLRVEFRSSAYGGTRVVVLVPGELTVPAPQQGPVGVPAAAAAAPGAGPAAEPTGPGDALPPRRQGEAMARVSALLSSRAAPQEPPFAGHTDPYTEPGDTTQAFAATPDAYTHADTFHAVNLYAAAPQPSDPRAESRYDAPGAADAPAGTEHSAFTGQYVTPLQPHSGYGTGTAAGTDGGYGTGTAAGTDGGYGTGSAAGTDGGYGTGTAPGTDSGTLPGFPSPDAAETPLPRRVRQASLADELRVDPATRPAPARPPRWQDDPLLRPVPRRAGATIGAFQRRSRAARSTGAPPAPTDPTAPRPLTREEDRS
ncbi:nitrate- and nitrite sensing domain-containing protein [Streptomyces sp. NPDC003023]|uniref:sensor histidine kinase n=1 Tax=Streptomyces sp. NPDC003023 TaxID=3364675 RepID=UPI00368E2E66